MITHWHKRLKKVVFKEQKNDWHSLVLVLFLIALIIYPFISEYFVFKYMIFNILYISFIFYGILLLDKPSKAMMITGATTFVLLVYLMAYYIKFEKVNTWLLQLELVLIIGYLFFLAVKLLRDTLNEKVSLKLIYISISNYLIIGLIFSLFFELIHITDIQAFNFPFSPSYNHMYTSFIVLTSVGLGDMLALSGLAKSAVMIEAITGQLYLTFFVAIIINKYYTERMNNNEK